MIKQAYFENGVKQNPRDGFSMKTKGQGQMGNTR